jgi:hypothetical protein
VYELEDKKIIFMHIPKTAGRTLRSILEKNYSKDEVIRTYSNKQIEQFQSLSKNEKDKLKLIIGHNFFGMHEQLEGPFSYITMLRDPIERVLSLYYFILREPGTPMYIKYNGKGLEYFLEEEPQTINWQTRFAAGGELNLAKAKDHLEKYFSVVGISERFNESLLLIEKELGLKNLTYKSINVTPNRPRKEDLSPHILKKVEENVNLDIELYNYALELFEEQLNELKQK